MIGILLDIGTGLKKPENVRDILDGKDVQMSRRQKVMDCFWKKSDISV